MRWSVTAGAMTWNAIRDDNREGGGRSVVVLGSLPGAVRGALRTCRGEEVLKDMY